jgi:hypothetical protein
VAEGWKQAVAAAKATRKPETASKTGLRREIDELRSIGRQMSNVCFNLGQRYREGLGPMAEIGPLHNFDAEAMRDLRVKWDAIKRAEVKRG